MAEVRFFMSWKQSPVPGCCSRLQTPGSPRLDLMAKTFLITCTSHLEQSSALKHPTFYQICTVELILLACMHDWC